MCIICFQYDPRFGDAFWNSSRYSMMQYLYLMMTSWAIVCDVWYLPPMNMMRKTIFANMTNFWTGRTDELDERILIVSMGSVLLKVVVLKMVF
jgi:hypothetical protein